MLNIKAKNSPIIMGILNLTPDSFSDGGKYNNLKKALQRAAQMEKEGADVIDIGGEATGPGSKTISPQEEAKRIIPILRALKKATRLTISVDTYKAQVAAQALEEGASIINDVTALRGDKEMAKIISKYRCPVIIMYSKDPTARTSVKNKKYQNITSTVANFLQNRIKYAERQGINPNQIILDPGMGQYISAIPSYSYEIIANIPKLKKLGRPILIGASRKSFLGKGTLRERDMRSKIVEAIAYLNGASIIRTHDIKGLKTWLKCS